MNPEHDAAEQIVNSATRMAVHTFEVLSSATLQGGLMLGQFLIQYLKQQHKTKGKTTISNFKDKPTKVFIIKRQDLELFAREAKKYGVLYAAVMDKKNNDGLVDIIVNDVDAAKVNRIADRFAMSMEDVRQVQEEILQAQAEVGDVNTAPDVGEQFQSWQTDSEYPEPELLESEHEPNTEPQEQYAEETFSMSEAQLDEVFPYDFIDGELAAEIEETFSMDESELDSLFIEDGEYSLEDSQLAKILGDDENPTNAETDRTASPSEQRSEKSGDSEIQNKSDKSVKKKIQDKRQQRRDNVVQPQPRIKNIKER